MFFRTIGGSKEIKQITVHHSTSQKWSQYITENIEKYFLKSITENVEKYFLKNYMIPVYNSNI